MIAVRGTIRHKGDRRSPNSSPTPTTPNTSYNKPNTTATETHESLFNPKQDTKPGEWIWTGYWAFGSLPPPEVLESISHHKRKKPPAGVRPFVYKFQSVKDAREVIVPSSLIYSDDDDGGASGGGGDNDTVVISANDTDMDTAMGDGEGEPVENKDDGNVETLKEGKEEDEKYRAKDDRDEKENMDIDVDVDQTNEEDKDLDLEHKEEVKSNHHNKTSNVSKSQSITKEAESKNDHNGVEIKNKEGKSVINDTTSITTATTEKTSENDTSNESKQPAEESTEDRKKSHSSKPPGESFAEMTDGSVFTDGGITYPRVCPIGGCWKGYFENVSKRKDRMSSRVQEVFHLFFNSTPPPDARMKFVDEVQVTDGQKDSSNKTIDIGELPKGYIHVRGSGTNQFGTFEILGGFNIETGVLACQRIYVSTSDSAETATDEKKEEKIIKESPSRKPVRKSYFTRKRPPGSWRSGSYGAYDDIYDTGTGRSNSGRKRQRAISEPGTKATLSTIDEAMGTTQQNIPDVPPASDTSKITSSSTTTAIPASNQQMKTTHVKQQDEPNPPASDPAPLTIPPKIPRRPSPTKSPSTSRRPRSSPSTSSVRSSPAINSSAYQIKIPKIGDPQDARWRAAHFIYFQKQTENNTDLTSPPTNTSTTAGSSSSSSGTTTNYVVYEGEMNFGKNLRDGRGVCLYNNGTIYEGEWKRNKEHGNGTLTTGDRMRIIYTGDWERGKMHGRGTYYYHMYSKIEHEVDSKNGGMYTGDFKENARHGVGTYTLPGGDVYSGDWRENVPCGKGTFKWSDGSSYDGMWKDGRRNGWGQLKCSDGFEYEGHWKDNAMEGRGRAIYPNGQQYDGMWLDGKRDGRGTIIFGNGAVYKGRFKEDHMEGQGTLKLDRNVSVTRPHEKRVEEMKDGAKIDESKTVDQANKNDNEFGNDWMIPIEFQSDIGRIHEKAGFTTGGE